MPLYFYVLGIQQLSPSCLLDTEPQSSDFKDISQNENAKIARAFLSIALKTYFHLYYLVILIFLSITVTCW